MNITNGIELAARFVEKRRDDYVQEHGSYDPLTGMTEFPGDGEEYVGELEEIIEGIRALAAAPTNAPEPCEIKVMPRGGVERDWYSEYQLLLRQHKKLAKIAKITLSQAYGEFKLTTDKG